MGEHKPVFEKGRTYSAIDFVNLEFTPEQKAEGEAWKAARGIDDEHPWGRVDPEEVEAAEAFAEAIREAPPSWDDRLHAALVKLRDALFEVEDVDDDCFRLTPRGAEAFVEPAEEELDAVLSEALGPRFNWTATPTRDEAADDLYWTATGLFGETAAAAMRDDFLVRTKPPTESWTTGELRALARQLPEEPGYVAGRLLAPATVLVTVGPAGVGKTTLKLLLGRCVALGEPFGPWKTKTGRVLFLSCELSDEEIAPLVADLFSAEETARMGDDFVIRCRPDLQPPTKIEDVPAFVERLREVIVKEGHRDVIIIDGLSDLHALEENSNAQMGALLRAIRNGIARRLRIAVAILHHFGKPSEFRTGSALARGASVIRDVAASMLTVEWQRPADEDGPRNVRLVKGRRREKGQVTSFGFDIVEDLERGEGLRLEFMAAKASPKQERNIGDLRELLGSQRLPHSELKAACMAKTKDGGLGWSKTTFDRHLEAAVKAGVVIKDRDGLYRASGKNDEEES